VSTPFRFFLACLLSALALAATPAHATRDPQDIDNAVEHPEIPRFPGFYIYDAKHNDFNDFQFASKGYNDDGEPVGERKAGQYWFVDYYIKDGARHPSPVELLRNFDNAVQKAGGAPVYRNRRIEFPQGTVYRLPLPRGGERWIQVNVHNEGERYQLFVVDVADMAQKLEMSAGQMADALKKQGHVALTGILFDTGKASIQPESQTLLREVRTLLAQDAQLRLSIIGHTDNVGNAKANAELSARRAEAVVAYLVGQGIVPQRLKASGKGDTTPVADNRTEEGRARNRRVELIRF
jgi:outer membrane protein OmpA-like peptidoglycan-associated protein